MWRRGGWRGAEGAPNVSRIRGVKAPKAPWNRLHGLPRLVESFRARDTIEKDEKILCLSGSLPNDRIRMRDPHRFIDNTKLSFYTMSWATPSEILGSLVRCEIAQAALIAREIIQKTIKFQNFGTPKLHQKIAFFFAEILQKNIAIFADFFYR